jgi:2-polyprenyl-6-hydroxyphenyl methylase/3-demethylubiquinone-9 3-methyltransferase
MVFNVKEISTKFITQQRRWCEAFDSILPSKFRIDGNEFFINSFIQEFLGKNQCVYDIGGGKTPFFSKSQKELFGMHIIGVDIDRSELDMAPQGCYDEVIHSDIAVFKGNNDGDLLICQALLEHVEDVSLAITSISTCLKPGGVALIFVPSRNAIFARLNLIIPEFIKLKLLNLIFPNDADLHGYKSYYDRCTPSNFKQLFLENDFKVVKESYHYISVYFQIFLPLYIVWRIWIILFYAVSKENASETFCIAFQKSSEGL